MNITCQYILNYMNFFLIVLKYMVCDILLKLIHAVSIHNELTQNNILKN